MQRYSERYRATGGLAAEGVINQLGRPDIEPLEVLVREAVQNCWDARREQLSAITVEIGRAALDEQTVQVISESVLTDPPPGLPLADELRAGCRLLYFADFGTTGLGGPTRADRHVEGEQRDFVDFVLNIGQPPDRDLGGGSFGYGKAAFYIASRARTVVVDTLCEGASGLERRLIAIGLGANYTEDGIAHTGRHWWGVVSDDAVGPVTGTTAAEVAAILGLPSRDGREGLGTTVAVIAPGIAPDGEETRVVAFIVDALLWNFWPKMVATVGGAQRTINFRLKDDGQEVEIPNPRHHAQLRDFVEAFDRLRSDPDPEDETAIDRRLECRNPIQDLGRLVIQKGPVAAVVADEVSAMPRGMRETLHGVHHVALMRSPELVVTYRRGPASATGRYGYAGVFKCSVLTDGAFRDSEPPTHDAWVVTNMKRGQRKTFVNVALQRIDAVCREAAGLSGGASVDGSSADIPLGEFADQMARLMPGFEGSGARAAPRNPGSRKGRSTKSRAQVVPGPQVDVWVDSAGVPENYGSGEESGAAAAAPGAQATSGEPAPVRLRPLIRVDGAPRPAITDDGSAVMRYPFSVRARGNDVLLSASIRVMTDDGTQPEKDPPRGWIAPAPSAWIGPDGAIRRSPNRLCSAAEADGDWVVEIPIVGEMYLGVDIVAEAI